MDYRQQIDIPSGSLLMLIFQVQKGVITL